MNMNVNNNLAKETTRGNDVWLIIGIILLATNFRPSLTSVGPLVNNIRDDLHLSNSVAGLITTVPLIAFAIMSPLAPKLGRKFGSELVLFLALIFLIIGLLIRSSGSSGLLFAGTAIIGLAIAVCNVLLPALIQQKFSKKVGLMTGLYTSALGTFAALASGISVPLSHGLGSGWRGSLVFWAVLAAAAAIIWIPQLRNREKPKNINMTEAKEVWRSPLAWQVTLFMGLQSLGFYVTVTWLPAILHDRGLSVSTAGWTLSLLQFISLPVSFLVPVLAARLSHQKWLAAMTSFCYIAGFGGLMIGSKPLVIMCVIFLGLGQGAALSLALLLFGLRTKSAHQAAELSGMAQSIGYLLAAVGPILFGYLRDVTHTWITPLLFIVITSGLMLISGIGAGRNKVVGDSPESGEYLKAYR
ncbi:MFS transporter [Fictibacillus gelatini]|uniref:CynX/NimT family MFS transporter n=1 Tax=Fictibacillus gelatini TaxID=225985 RepID=UPI000412C77C|nr:MFS transporter [Fictibacillus gelatini]